MIRGNIGEKREKQRKRGRKIMGFMESEIRVKRLRESR